MLQLIDRVEEKRIYVCVCVCAFVNWCIAGTGLSITEKRKKIPKKEKAKRTATAVHIFHLSSEDVTSATILGNGKIIQPGFPLHDAKSRKNRILRLASNVVQYYSARLKVRANMATATTIAGSEERKQCQIGETGEGNIGCSALKTASLRFKTISLFPHLFV